MKLLFVLAAAAAVWAQPQSLDTAFQPQSTTAAEDGNERRDANVNSRYMVESVGVANVHHYHLSNALIHDMQQLVGARFSSDAFQNIAQRISSELHGYQVVFKLRRGVEPGHIRVVFEVNGPSNGFDIDVPLALYNSHEGLSGEADAVVRAGANEVLFGGLSNADTFVDRVSGLRARYDRVSVGSDRIRLGFEFDALRDDYDPATVSAAAKTGDALYRARQSFEPTASIAIAGPLTWTAGLSFERLQPAERLAPVEMSNAVISSLRYRQEWTDSTLGRHRFDAVYRLRAATTALGAAYAYTRHVVDVSYHWKRGRQAADVEAEAGVITGKAPLFDRFVLGTSNMLRGWNKYEIDPLGGSRVAYGSACYSYRMAQAFYDTGAIWDRGHRAQPRQSAGIGVKVQGVLLALAFPIRSGRVEPVFIAGMNF